MSAAPIGLLRLNTRKLTMFCDIVRIVRLIALSLSLVVHGRSSLVESFDWLNQFLCDEREKKERREGEEEEKDRREEKEE